MQDLFKNFTFRAGDYLIKNRDSIKILGHIIQSNLKMCKTVNKLSSELHYKIHNIRKLTSVTDFNTRCKFLNAYIIGKINYLLPLFSFATQVNLRKLHKIIMTAARAAIGSFCFRKNISYILDKCKWFSIRDLILYSSLAMVHKILVFKQPAGLLSVFRIDNSECKVKTSTTVYKPTSIKLKNFYLYKYAKIYNNLDPYIKKKSVNGFKNEIKLMIRAGTIIDTMD